MGTENLIFHTDNTSPIIDIVKLNNPLMGTEKSLVMLSITHIPNILVKLNNPLMGTEKAFNSLTSLVNASTLN